METYIGFENAMDLAPIIDAKLNGCVGFGVMACNDLGE